MPASGEPVEAPIPSASSVATVPDPAGEGDASGEEVGMLAPLSIAFAEGFSVSAGAESAARWAVGIAGSVLISGSVPGGAGLLVAVAWLADVVPALSVI
jgi:hypothetical protein